MEFTKATQRYRSYDDTSSTVVWCCRSGNVVILKELLKKGKPVDVQDQRGWRPIHEAVNANSVSCLRILINHEGSDLNWKTFKGETPLLLAARNGLYEIVHTLLQSGADVNSVSNENETPLIAAAGSGCVLCVRMFLQEGAKLTDVDYSKSSALHRAADKNCMKMIAYLLEHGASVSLQEDAGKTPVFLAAKNGCLNGLILMLKHGKDQGNTAVDVATYHGTTPLMIAAQNGHLACVKLLVAHGADANYMSNGNMALHLAITGDHFECVKYLVSVTDAKILTPNRKEVLLNMSDERPVSPMHLAIVTQRYNMLVLMAECWNVDDFLHLILDEDTYFNDPSIQDVPYCEETFWPCAYTCLGEAASFCDDMAVKLLLKIGCRPDAPTEEAIIVNPLTMATLLGREEIMELLLEAGADPNHRAPSVGSESWSQMFPLLAAELNGERSVVEILLKAGADVRRIIPRHNTAGSSAWRYVNQGDIDQDYLDILSRMAEFTIDPHGSLMKLLRADPSSAKMDKREIFGPPRLSHLCRVTIRHAIIDGDSAINYRKKVKNLQLPSILEQVLTFERD